MKSVYKVAFISLKSCLVNLPEALNRTLSSNNVAAQDVVAVLSFDGSKQAYAGWTGHGSKDGSTIEIDPAFAKNIGVSEGTELKVDLRMQPREAEVVWVEPVTADDWEIMELHASFLELNLLNQIRAVSLEHPLTVYLSAHTTASVIVRKIEPELKEDERFAKISTNAEVVVSPKTRGLSGPGSLRAPSASSNKPSSRTDSHKRPRSVFLRAAPDASTKLKGFNVFLPADLRSVFEVAKYLEIQEVLPPTLRRRAQAVEAIAPALPPRDKSTEAEVKQATKIVVRAHLRDDVPENHILLSPEVFKTLDLDTGSRLKINLAPEPKKLSKLTYHRILTQSKRKEIKFGGNKDADLLETLKNQISSLGEGPVTHGLRINDFLISLQSPGDWSPIPSIDKLSITKGEDVVKSTLERARLSSLSLKGVETVAMKVQKICQRFGGVLLHGSRGSGKSSIASMCAKCLEERYNHVVIADCSKLSEERVSTVKEALNRWFSEAAWYEPSVIMIDDLDRLCPAEVEHADSTRARQLAEIFLSILRQFTSRHAISILATCQAKEALHSLLVTSHVFDETISLKPPAKTARGEIAQSLVDAEQGSKVDWLEIANMTDGYLAGDLKFLTERAKHEGLMREMVESPEAETNFLQTVDYEKAISGFTPASLRGIKLQKSSVEWKDIGGLVETRRILLETLEWPTRYAPIFANCPLRLRSGLLLYGYPGCGKTLLASAVASECGLNFIAVKGPEILNKYIGASEKSVRDLFDRAQAAKPCVLFFDEFDSIAPKRGHDSTGVTDRVVNQMLTQMDGAEGLEGVYVLAATSRPDLIDPALLRPGRLDKSLLCNMPAREDRCAILAALSRKMHVASEVDLDRLAARTEGFSGADLQAVLYNAHLEAIHDVLSRTESEMSASQTLEDGESNKKEVTTFTRFRLGESVKNRIGATVETSAEKAAISARIEAILANTGKGQSSNQVVEAPTERVIEISWANLEKSLGSTKPSISAAERQRLDRVYHDFVDGRSPDGLPDGQVAPGEQRATLA
ncbi:putative Peroxisome biosynthesis protein [Taphrina deformans PYCC 5710]|uniref:Peroxisomal ATPase PEX1 n=1 Tax=Taphrina deformans (strain PYCC 5710 / ATCC 11124 / CBS 356.35 / IMI 108563 / JCM 9778 / NBRC 8474) TaxID=1097556 RepID=R4X6M9_TAPDE|nr:putative Peroxisome biosynthesis protein [Taphrina deformans PYCC 5710]|eukprot:CCG80832.1 putative Peroxisome biosynthesis protein [Taphrina deformans PYCC 5710]